MKRSIPFESSPLPAKRANATIATASAKLKKESPVDLTPHERKVRNFIETNSTTTRLEVRNCMIPWLSHAGANMNDEIIIPDNYYSVSSRLLDEITNDFNGNPIGAELNGKAHGKELGSDMSWIFNNVSEPNMT